MPTMTEWSPSAVAGFIAAAAAVIMAVLFAIVHSDTIRKFFDARPGLVKWVIRTLCFLLGAATVGGLWRWNVRVGESAAPEVVEVVPLDLRVDDSTFILGHDDIDISVSNVGNATAVVQESALLLVGETQCDVALRGDRILSPGETRVLLVDGSRMLKSVEISEHQCKLRYSVIQSSSADLEVVDQVFRFRCERVLGLGGFITKNLC